MDRMLGRLMALSRQRCPFIPIMQPSGSVGVSSNHCLSSGGYIRRISMLNFTLENTQRWDRLRQKLFHTICTADLQKIASLDQILMVIYIEKTTVCRETKILFGTTSITLTEFPRNPEARWILPPVLMGCNNTLSLCIHLHCYHFDLLEEIADRLANISFPFSLVVTVCSKDDVGEVRTLLGNLNNSRSTHVKLCENRGRDIAPFLIDASETWRDYDLVLHIHTKKSPHISWGGSWRRYLLDQTIGQGPLFESIVEYFRDNTDVGFMYPENYSMIKHFTEEENNVEKIMMTAKLLNISSDFSRIAEFPAGSMAFYRVRALNNLLDNEVIERVFEDECGQLDGTGAHALERLIPEVVRQAGFRGRSYFWLSSR